MGEYLRGGVMATLRTRRANQSPPRVSPGHAGFPTSSVCGDTTHRTELHLITGGGPFDARTGHYDDNIVAYAHLLDPHP